MNAICFLTMRPRQKFYNFCKELKNSDYDVYICIDDSSHTIPTPHDFVKIIQMDEKVNVSAGFSHTLSDHPRFSGKISSVRDKALYYFAKKKSMTYKFIWFIEEDVFIPTTSTIKNIDDNYGDQDLLLPVSLNIVNSKYDVEKLEKEGKPNCPNTFRKKWNDVFESTKNLGFPYGKSMMCAMRSSDRLLSYVEKYATTNKRLFLDECLFSTLCLHNKLDMLEIEELRTIHYRKEWKPSDIKISNLYHPIKDIDVQYKYRKLEISK